MKRPPYIFEAAVRSVRALCCVGVLAISILAPIHIFNVTSHGYKTPTQSYIYPLNMRGGTAFYMNEAEKAFGEGLLIVGISLVLIYIVTKVTPGMRKF